MESAILLRINMATEGEIKTESNEVFEWNVENEIHLFEAMIGFKPIGIHKHFHMACICEKFETLMGKTISPDIIWEHLSNMYDLSALDKKETTPFPNEEEEFTLPVSDFSDLIAEKLSKADIINESISKDEKSTSKSIRESTQGNSTNKKEKKIDHEDGNVEIEKKETEEYESESRKGKPKKDEKPVGKRGKRSLKDKKNDEEVSQVSTPIVKKGDDDSSTTQNSNKKGKRMIGKRSLRSRADDTSYSKSSTPPPTKRARRI